MKQIDAIVFFITKQKITILKIVLVMDDKNKKNMVLDVSCKKSFKANKGNEYIIIGGFYFA